LPSSFAEVLGKLKCEKNSLPYGLSLERFVDICNDGNIESSFHSVQNLIINSHSEQP